MENNRKKPIYRICECAIFVALAVAISFIEIKVGASGGSIDFVMIPLFIICYRHGVKYSFLSCLAFSLMYCLVGGKFGYGLPSVLLDYVLAYTALGVAGIFAGKSKCIELSVLLGCVARFAIHFISGVTLYAITTATQIEGTNIVTSNAVVFSLIYNVLYMLPNTVIAVLVMSFLRIPLVKLQKRAK